MKPFKFFLVCVFVMSLSVISYSQDDNMEINEYYEEDIIVEEMPIEGEENEKIEYAYGEIVTTDKDKGTITINEYNWDTNEEFQMVYSVKEDVELEGANDLIDIPKGSYVDIEYSLDENGNKVAEYIVIYSDEE